MTGLSQQLQAEIGVTRHSEWLLIDQAMVDRFADATFDHQFIHIDPERAAATPFGGTIAHGFLTLSLLPHLCETLMDTPSAQNGGVGVNYGFDRLRFVHPVRTGSRIRVASTLASVEEKRPGQFQQMHDVAVEIEGEERPALIATWITQFFI